MRGNLFPSETVSLKEQSYKGNKQYNMHKSVLDNGGNSFELEIFTTLDSSNPL